MTTFELRTAALAYFREGVRESTVADVIARTQSELPRKARDYIAAVYAVGSNDFTYDVEAMAISYGYAKSQGWELIKSFTLDVERACDQRRAL